MIVIQKPKNRETFSYYDKGQSHDTMIINFQIIKGDNIIRITQHI